MNPENPTPDSRAPGPAPVQPEMPPAQPSGPVVLEQGIPAPPPPAPPKSKKKLVIIAAAVLAILTGLYVYGKQQDNSPAIQDTSSEDSIVEEEPVHSAEETHEETINKKVEADLGFSFTIQKLVRNFVDEDLEADEEGILVSVKAESNGEYTTTVGESMFRVLADDGEEIRTHYLITDDDMKKAKYTPLETTSVKVDAPVSGYVAFAIPKGTKKLTFRYHRAKTKILGGDTHEAKNFDTVIVQ